MKEELTEEQKLAKESTNLDQFYFIHTNKLVLFGLSERHEAIANNAANPITSVCFDVGKKQRSQNQVSGKHKSKVCSIDAFIVGGTRLDSRTIVCEVRCADGKVYKVRSFVNNAYVIEMNQRIVDAPQLLATKVWTCL